MIGYRDLKKLFEDNPEKSTITFKGKCSECGYEIIIDVTPTSGGFGLKGGILFKCLSDEYFANCTNCYKVNPKIGNPYKSKHKCIIVK